MNKRERREAVMERRTNVAWHKQWDSLSYQQRLEELAKAWKNLKDLGLDTPEDREQAIRLGIEK